MEIGGAGADRLLAPLEGRREEPAERQHEPPQRRRHAEEVEEEEDDEAERRGRARVGLPHQAGGAGDGVVTGDEPHQVADAGEAAAAAEEDDRSLGVAEATPVDGVRGDGGGGGEAAERRPHAEPEAAEGALLAIQVCCRRVAPGRAGRHAARRPARAVDNAHVWSSAATATGGRARGQHGRVRTPSAARGGGAHRRRPRRVEVHAQAVGVAEHRQRVATHALGPREAVLAHDGQAAGARSLAHGATSGQRAAVVEHTDGHVDAAEEEAQVGRTADLDQRPELVHLESSLVLRTVPQLVRHARHVVADAATHRHRDRHARSAASLSPAATGRVSVAGRERRPKRETQREDEEQTGERTTHVVCATSARVTVSLHRRIPPLATR